MYKKRKEIITQLNTNKQGSLFALQCLEVAVGSRTLRLTGPASLHAHRKKDPSFPRFSISGAGSRICHLAVTQRNTITVHDLPSSGHHTEHDYKYI